MGVSPLLKRYDSGLLLNLFHLVAMPRGRNLLWIRGSLRNAAPSGVKGDSPSFVRVGN